MSTTVFGVEFDGDLPEGWTPLEAVVTVKCLNAEGNVSMTHYASDGLNSFEAYGMTQWTADTLRNALLKPDEGD